MDTFFFTRNAEVSVEKALWILDWKKLNLKS